MQPEYTPLYIERFWSHVDKNGPVPAHRPELGPCWLWAGPRNRKGYGRLGIRKQKVYAHRMSFAIANGPFQDDLFVLHHCDNPACVNPTHLFTGTQDENMKDMKAKGRAASGDQSGPRLHRERMARGERNGSQLHPESRPRGESHYLHKLTEADVRSIRAQHLAGNVSMRSIARSYSVGSGIVSRILRRKAWKHVD